MKNQSTKKVFEDFTQNSISDETANEIEKNLKEYFSTIVEWLEINKKEDKQENE